MKKLFVLLFFVLSACTFGDFSEKREKLHNSNNDICQTKPERCINGVPW